MPRPSTARRAGRSTRPGRNSHGRQPHGHAGDGVPLAAFRGDASRHPRTPARQRDESPWIPGPPPAGRERRGDHSASTRDCPAVSRPAGSRSGSVRWLPMGRHHCASTHLSRCTPAASASVTRGMQDMYSVQRNILPGRSRDVRTTPKSLPQNRATALPAVARTPDMKVSPGLFRHPHPRGRAPRRRAWQGRYPLP